MKNAASAEEGVPKSRSLFSRLPINMDLYRFLSPFAIFLVFLAWYLIGLFMPHYIFPDPFETLRAVGDIFIEGILLKAVGNTLIHILVAFFAAGVLGTLIGMAMGRVRWIEAFGQDLVPLFQTIPGLVLISICIILFKFTNKAIMFSGFVFGLPNMIIGVWQGTKNIDANLVEMARIYGHSEWSIMHRIVIPWIIPDIISGLRVVMGLLWHGILFAEFMIGGGDCFGYQLYAALILFNIPRVFAWGVSVVSIMIIMEYGFFRPLENRLMVWKKRALQI
jgi:NitT/TauT family transport system permease protein